MTRKFLPAGQGACYLEQFEDGGAVINVMYDCGSATSLYSLQSAIENHIRTGSDIHAVFISHFDEDHINGLPFLTDNYNVKNLFVPLLTENEINIIKLNCLSGHAAPARDSFLWRFINQYPYFEDVRVPAVYYVRPRQGSGDEERPELTNGWDISAHIVESGSNVSEIITARVKPGALSSDWLYVPFNFRQYERYDMLIAELRKEHSFSEHVKSEDILKLIEKDDANIQKIRNAYKRIPGSLNVNSMVLYSGSADKELVQKIESSSMINKSDIFCKWCNERAKTRNGCLYTGDYDASGTRKWKDMKNAYARYWDSIGCIQIPHHGSCHNYTSTLTDKPECLYVISAGKKNRYGLPNGSVIKDMLYKGIVPFIVTEDKRSELEFIVF